MATARASTPLQLLCLLLLCSAVGAVRHGNRRSAKMGAVELRRACPDDSSFCATQARRDGCVGGGGRARAVRRFCACSCDAALNRRLSTCCSQVVRADMAFCVPLCRYNVTLTELTAPSGLQCLSQLQAWLYCAADENEAVSCCRSRGVPSKCDALCRGRLPACAQSDLLRFTDCIEHIETVLSCTRDSLKAHTQWDPDWKADCEIQWQ